MEVYRRLARIRDAAKIDDFRTELRDRYGPVPTLRMVAAPDRASLAGRSLAGGTIHRNGPDIVLTYRSAKRIKQLVEKSRGRLKWSMNRGAYWRLQEGEDGPERLYGMLKGVMAAGSAS